VRVLTAASFASRLCTNAQVLGGSTSSSSGGGGGDREGAGPAADAGAEAPAAAEVFDCSEVIELQRRGEAAAASVASWWPAAWPDAMPRGEPDRTVLAEKLIPMAEEKSGVKFAEGEKIPVLQGVLYVTRAPTSVPPGALDQLGVGGQIAEGEEAGPGQVINV
jgi:hypothetical protein